MGMVSVSLGDASDPTRREGEGQMGPKKKDREEGRRPQEALLMGMGGCWAEEKFRMIKMEKEKPEGEGSTHC